MDDPGTRYILFSTWGAAGSFPKEYCFPGMTIDASLDASKNYCSPKIEDPYQEMKLLNEGYAAIASATGIEKTNHGNLYFKAAGDFSSVRLLADSMHPSESGAFLNASVFYAILTGQKASDLNYKAKLDQDVAINLKKYADENYR